MNKNLTFLAIFLLAACFLSCEKEAPIEVVTYTESTTQVATIQQLVVFQYSYIDEEAGTHSGWIINNRGEVKSYVASLEDNPIPSTDVYTATQMRTVYRVAETFQTEVDMGELKANFRLIYGASLDRHHQQETHPQAAFITFQEIEQGHSMGCGGGQAVENNWPTSYDRIILDANHNEASASIINWLEQINETIDN